MVSLLNKQRFTLSKLVLFATAILLSSSSLLFFLAPTSYALGETYKWNGSTITASGGQYKSTVTFTSDHSFTPGKDNTPSFNGPAAGADDKSGNCRVYVSLTFAGKNTSSAKLNFTDNLIGSGPGSSCSQSTTTKYSNPVTVKGTPNGASSAPKTREVIIISKISDSEDYPPGDTITFNEGKTGKVLKKIKLTAKNASKDVGDGFKGYKVSVKNLSYGFGYSACSKTLDACGEVSATTYPPEPGASTISITKDAEDNTASCAIDGIGWIVCPVMNFMAKLNDQAFNFLEKFLTVRPALVTDPATRTAWTAFRDIANVLFVIAFLVIVYSQLTSAGISNYGIKKMLPRLFIAAILVNLSYYVCAIAVDLSNILGSSIYSLFKDSIGVGTGGTSGGVGGAWESLMGKVLVGVAYIAILAVIIVAPVVLLAFAVIILILIARQAFAILLIVVAPIAFVAYLLPNTEQWFKKWWKALVAVLMVYPIIAAVFGVSSLASKILMNIADDGGSGGDDEQLLKIVALGVLAIPLFAVPALLKGSLSAAGSVGAKLSSLGDKSTKFAGKKAMEGRLGEAKASWDRGRQTSRFKRRAGEGRLTKWGESRGGKFGSAVAWAGTRQRAFDQSKLGAKLGGTRGAAVATQGIHKQFDEDVSAFKSTLTGTSNDTLVKTLEKGEGSDEYLAAVAGEIMSRDHRDSHVAALRVIGRKARAAEASGDENAKETISNIQKQMTHDMKDKPWALGDEATGQLGNGTYGLSTSHTDEPQTQYGNIDEEIKDRVGKKLSAKNLADMNPDEMRAIYEMATGTHASGVTLDPPEINNLKQKIADLRLSRYKDDVKPQAKAWHDNILLIP